MRAAEPVAGGGRRVRVSPERLAGWLERFQQAHGPGTWAGPTLTCPDGATVTAELAFGTPAGPELVAAALRPRKVGVLLVRLGGFAAGVFDGDTLVASKVGSRLVHGRSAAGGTSQLRFARRREGQAAVALAAAADCAARVLLPHERSLDGFVTGGDRAALRTVLDDPRLSPLTRCVSERVLDVPEPRHAVLLKVCDLYRAVHLIVTD